MKNYVSEGHVLTLAAPYALTSGQGMLVGNLFGVATKDADSAANVEALTVGIVALTKATGEAWVQGDNIYWDDTNRECTVSAAGNRLIGVAVRVEASGNVVGRVRLNGGTTGDQEGNTVTLAAPYDVSAGDGMLVGSLFGVAQHDGLTAADVVVSTVGAHVLPKLSSAVISQGAKVYWDDTNKECVATASGNKLIGAALIDAGDGDTSVTVRLNGVTV